MLKHINNRSIGSQIILNAWRALWPKPVLLYPPSSSRSRFVAAANLKLPYPLNCCLPPVRVVDPAELVERELSLVSLSEEISAEELVSSFSL